MSKAVFYILAVMVMSSFASAEVLTYKTGAYDIYDDGDGYELLVIENGEQWEMESQFNEPVSMSTFSVASDKAIKSVTLKEKRLPKELTLNIPLIYYTTDESFEYLDSDCEENFRDAYALMWFDTFSSSPTILVEIHPLEITDCKNQKFTLYQELDIEVEYYEENKIKSFEHSEFVPGKEATLTFEFENLEGNGQLVVSNGVDKISESVDSETIEISMFVPEDIADFYFAAEYYEDGDVVDRQIISQSFKWGSVDFRVLVSDDRLVLPIAVQVENLLGKEIPVFLEIASLDDYYNEVSKVERVVSVPSGVSINYVQLNITEDEAGNDVSVRAAYNGVTEFAEHNSLVRFTLEEVRNGLPQAPGISLFTEVESEGDSKAAEGSETSSSWKGSTFVGIAAALAIFGVVVYIAFKYLGKKEEY